MTSVPRATLPLTAHPERELLQRLITGPVSGDSLARASGQTRAAVWKRIEALREAGVAIQARPGRGYALAHPLELLDPEAIREALSPESRDRVESIEVRWSVPSSNSELAAAGIPDRGIRVLLAERQTGGRGRRGRQWASPLAANLYLSAARRFEGGLARLPGLSLVAGIVAAEALRQLGFAGVGLKWPNDLVVADPDGGLRKLGGILVEGGGEHAGPVHAVIGIGINVRMPDDMAIDQPWTDLHAIGAGNAPSRNLLAASVLSMLAPALDRFDRDGLGWFLRRYAMFDALRDAAIVLRTGHDEIAGIALGLADDGALRVALPEGERHFHAGEISLRKRGGT